MRTNEPMRFSTAARMAPTCASKLWPTYARRRGATSRRASRRSTPRAIRILLVLLLAGPYERCVDQERDRTRAREHDRLFEELAAVLERRAWQHPVAEEDAGERAAPLRHDEIRGDATAARACVR